jgi:hypothetical protein
MNKYVFLGKTTLGCILEFTNLIHHEYDNSYISNAFLIIRKDRNNTHVEVKVSKTTLTNQLIKQIKHKILYYE